MQGSGGFLYVAGGIRGFQTDALPPQSWAVGQLHQPIATLGLHFLSLQVSVGPLLVHFAGRGTLTPSLSNCHKCCAVITLLSMLVLGLVILFRLPKTGCRAVWDISFSCTSPLLDTAYSQARNFILFLFPF